MTTLIQPNVFRLRARSRLRIGLTCLVLCLACVGWGSVGVARAGEWAQVTCSDGSERVPAEGWVHGSIGGYPANTGQGDTCEQAGGSLSLRDEASVYQLPESGPMWVYDAPQFSTIQGGTMTLSLASPGGQAYLATPNNDTNVNDLVLMCTELCTTVKETTSAIHQLGGTRLFAVTECIPGRAKACAQAAKSTLR